LSRCSPASRRVWVSRTRELVGHDIVDAERSTSKSAVSREFVGRTGQHLRVLISRSLADVRLAALMLDGIDLKGRCCVVCLGVSTDTPDFVFERGPIGVLRKRPAAGRFRRSGGSYSYIR